VSNFSNRLTYQWRDVANLVLGAWIVISPWALGFAAERTAAWNAYVVGVIIAVAALATLVNFQKWEEWVNIVLGAWLIVSPWALGVVSLSAHAWSQALAWNQVIVGLIVGVLAIWTAISGYEPKHLAGQN
jgi:hypothetical protein